jgi:WD40 repeat protein
VNTTSVTVTAQTRYDAFISYRRADGGFWAWRLRRRLKGFRLPTLIAQTTRPLQIYLDKIYARADDDFFERTIKPALQKSRHLIVVQTQAASLPRSDGSKNWVVREIEYFRSLEQGDNISIALAQGSTDDPLPADLHRTLTNIERVDIRSLASVRGLFSDAAILPFVAKLHDVAAERMPDLAREEDRLKARRLFAALTAATAVLLLFAVLAVWALNSRASAITERRNGVAALGRAERDSADSLATLAQQARSSADPLAAMQYLSEARLRATTPLVTAESLRSEPPVVSFDRTLLNADPGASTAVFDPAGRWIALGLFDGSLRLYRTGTWTVEQTLASRGGPVTAIAFSGNGEWMFVARRTPPLEPEESTGGGLDAYRRGTDGFRHVAALKPPGKDVGFLSVASDATADVVVAANTDGVALWTRQSWETGSLLATPKPVASIAVRDDGQTIAAGSREGVVWSWVTSSRQRTQLRSQPPPSDQTYPRNVMGVAFDPLGPRLASGSYDGFVPLITTGPSASTLLLTPAHAQAVNTVRFSRDGRWLASGGWDGAARLWLAGDARHVAQMRVPGDGIVAVEFSPDGQWIATTEVIARSSTNDGRWIFGTVRLWRVSLGRADERVELLGMGYDNKGRSVRWELDDQRHLNILAAGGRRGTDLTGSAWTAMTESQRRGTAIFRLEAATSESSVATGEVKVRLGRYGSDQLIVGSSLSPAGDQLAVLRARVDDELLSAVTVALIRVQSGTTEREIPLAGSYRAFGATRFSPNGRKLAIAVTEPSSERVLIVDLESGTVDAPLDAGNDGICSLSFHPGGRLLAAGTTMQSIYVWELDTRVRRDLEADLAGTALVVAFSPAGKFLVSASLASMKRWSVASWKADAKFLGLSFKPSALDFTPDGVLAIGMETGGIEFWDPARWLRLTSFVGHRSAVSQLVASPDADRMNTVAREGVRSWGSVPRVGAAERITLLRLSDTALQPLADAEAVESRDASTIDGDPAAVQFWRIWNKCCGDPVSPMPEPLFPIPWSRNGPDLGPLRHWLAQNPKHPLARAATLRLGLFN